jgi:hypothetical protein
MREESMNRERGAIESEEDEDQDVEVPRRKRLVQKSVQLLV